MVLDPLSLRIVRHSPFIILQLSKSEFRDLALLSGFNEDQEPTLCDFFENNKESIDAVLGTLTPSLLHYHDLEWRFDVQVNILFCVP